MSHLDVLEKPPRRSLHRVRDFTLGVVGADVSTAVVVAATAAVPISIVDYSIIARVAGVTDNSFREVWRGTKTLLLQPHRFFLPCVENKRSIVFAVCFTVYAATYIGSNMTKSYCEARGYSAERGNFAAGVASGVINTVASVWKDGVILRSLPPLNRETIRAGKRPVPWLTRALFCGRDTLTCIAAFTVAPMVATWLSRWCRGRGDAVDGRVQLPLSNMDMAQLITPAALQFVTTLMHVTAIRYRQTYPKFDFADLRTTLRDTYLTSTLLRIVRILPSFGFGAILNREMRSNLLDRVEGPGFNNYNAEKY